MKNYREYQNTSNGFKAKIAFEVIMILAALLLFCLVTRMWSLVFLVIPGIIIAALRMLFLSSKKDNADVVLVVSSPTVRPDTEQDVIRLAFGILQRRVTEEILYRYPCSRWVWEMPNSMERFAEGLPLTIILNSAGGYRKATVQVCNLRFCGLVYESAPLLEIEQGSDTGQDVEDDETIDYTLVAFQWVESNLLDLNNLCNDAIAYGLTTLLIPACKLPHPDSWVAVCDELTRNGFSEAIVQADGISVEIPNNYKERE